MNPLTILQLVQVALAVAKSDQVAALAQSAKQFITALFTAGAISKEEQDATMAYVDAAVGLVKAGIIPPHWQVQPDPVA